MQQKRRDFLKIGASTAALCALGTNPLRARAAADPAKAKKTPIGLQLFAVRGKFKEDVAGTLQTVAEIGYDGVEFWGYGGEPTIRGKTGAELRAILDDVGLVCCGSHHAKRALEDDRIADTIAMAKTLGHRFLIIAASAPDMADREKVLRFADFLNAQAKRAAGDGVRVGYHAHGFDFKVLGDATAWEILFSNTAPEVIMQLDVGNSMGGGGDPIAMLRKFPGRCASLHIKEHPSVPLGEGDVDWETVFSLCEKKHKTEWYVVEQGDPGGNGYQMPKQALEMLRKWGK